MVSLYNFPWNIVAYTLVSFPIDIVLKIDSKKDLSYPITERETQSLSGDSMFLILTNMKGALLVTNITIACEIHPH